MPGKGSSGKRNVLAAQVQELAKEYDNMERTGEPFGTITIVEMARKLEAKGKDIIFCAESIISTQVPGVVLDETERNFREAAVGPEAPFLGLPELRQAIASRFKRLYGQDVDWNRQIILTSGSMQSEYYLMAALLNPGDEVIVPTPTFFFDIPVRLARGKPVFMKLDPNKNYYHDARQFERLITKKTKIITLCNPHNPTGRVLTEEELSGIAELAVNHDLYIMHDQVYERMVYGSRPYFAMAKFPEVRGRLISITSFSKLFNMMNYRLGYAVGPASVIHGMELIHAFSSMGIPVPLQKGAIPALNQAFEDRHIAETLAQLQKARDYAVEKLGSVEGVKISSPEGTNLLLPDISSFGMGSMGFCKYLLNEAGVACAPGAAYHAEGHVRISLGTERIKEAIDRIVATVSKLPTKKVAKKIVVRA
ncbi:MAG: aminotransferase class I/II-fold pyridoxal phosphate-dependent enzyme [Thaumarchaeota archaeon]|nr:aminotransferase class I/II-fold pyridoxal phosphate-dependent enzyme [Nitrososphaerota archaeon]